MELVSIFGTWVAAAKLESLDINAALEYVKTLDNKDVSNGDNGSVTVTQKLLDAPIFKNVKEECEYLSKLYVEDQGHIVDQIKISSSWGNTLKQNEPINIHNHPNSYVSGVFYLTEGSPLNFHNPLTTEDLFTFRPLIKWDENNSRTWQMAKLGLKPGWVFIFPSKLKHHVNNNDNEYRYSVAFNTLPVGLTGDLTQQINIKTIE